MKPVLYLLVSIALFASCIRPRYEKVMGYKPIYSENLKDLPVAFKESKAVASAGKIYLKGNYVFQIDNSSGIHVFERTTPSELKNIGFITLPGASEISIRGNHLYTNAFSNLVVVDISDIKKPLAISYVKEAFSRGGTTESFDAGYLLPERGVYYECINAHSGLVVGWKKEKIDPYCYNP